MRIADKIGTRRPFFSFEFFPPKDDAAEQTLFATIETLRPLDPGFVSITYGAGGSTRSRTVDLAKRLRGDAGFDVMAHLTCTGATVDDLRGVLRDLRSGGIENVLALRGDPPRGSEGFVAVEGGLRYANDLIALVKREFAFCVGGAAYPEKHPEAVSLDADLQALAAKVRAGAEFLVTQLFFDNARYVEFVERARQWGITVPILPGIMPITNYEQIDRFTRMCGATIPASLRAELEARRNDPQAVIDLGVAYATLQVADLLARGAPGIHFYTLNRSPATRAVMSAMLAARRAW
ncbi:methylenetetrahydrofolate reductase [Vulcanimicrobium alpinum]|uniref:Methylenetetrahydrofolate reductase n=1 Tax=Vulcanimicrobium alpinum TaxID=3016050 RepID=A0AAN1XY65_UNVUL|nr:methylenetetrahydrofolate reductase [NAD(P)H] [Vulcanimicrobium alpinum]BDE07576.1 methylenetetrahydrofolate reductase [Vulcanimicrobium alpinum]